MEIYELTGEVISAKIRTLGAELISLKDNEAGKEYMWSGDPCYWSRVSPVLFPFVGKLKKQQYTYSGTVYNPKPHGFARDMCFSVVEKEKDRIVFQITDTAETMKVYPFHFQFQIEYKIDGKNLTVSFSVKNNDEKKMYFSLGAHPGFCCPLKSDEQRKDCYIGFEGTNKLVSREVDVSTGLVNDKYREYALENGLLSIADDLFVNDALVLENNQVRKVTLHGADKKPYLSLEMDAPIYGIWSAAKEGSPFVCIEPWFGRCDATDFSGDLEHREYQNSLSSQEYFKTSYTIHIY